jgi:hypothetical protein
MPGEQTDEAVHMIVGESEAAVPVPVHQFTILVAGKFCQLSKLNFLLIIGELPSYVIWGYKYENV